MLTLFMAEYINYNGRRIKIGSCENILYTSYARYIKALSSDSLTSAGNKDPKHYAAPQAGYIFRFPFPDEDHYSFGEIGDNDPDRMAELGIPFCPYLASALGLPKDSEAFHQRLDLSIGIFGQKLMQTDANHPLVLETVVFNYQDGRYYRLPARQNIAHLLNAITLQFLQNKSGDVRQYFWAKMAVRMAQGYLATKKQVLMDGL